MLTVLAATGAHSLPVPAQIDVCLDRGVALEAKLEEMVLPFAQAIQRLDEIPGVGPIAATVIVARR